jgi:hypothetical protein
MLASLQRKGQQADRLFTELVAHMNEARAVEPYTYDQEIEVPAWLAS